VDEVLGRELEVGSFDMIRAINPWAQNRAENWDAFFCSELVAEGLQQLGVLRDDDELNSNDVLPRSFDTECGLLEKFCLEGHSYSDVEMIIDSSMSGGMCSSRRPRGDRLVAELNQHKEDSKRRQKERRSREAE